jgi:hypothetical protein
MVQWFIWNLECLLGTGSGVFLIFRNQVNEKLFLSKLLSRQHLSLRLKPASEYWGLENVERMRPHGKSESWYPGSFWCDSTPGSEVPREFFRIKSWRIRRVIENLSSSNFFKFSISKCCIMLYIIVIYSFYCNLFENLVRTALDSESHHW